MGVFQIEIKTQNNVAFLNCRFLGNLRQQSEKTTMGGNIITLQVSLLKTGGCRPLRRCGEEQRGGAAKNSDHPTVGCALAFALEAKFEIEAKNFVSLGSEKKA
jgi:hypothetical protein